MSVTELQDIPRESAPSQKRRGPRTVSGKARVALNALKHGRRSRPGRHLEMLSASMAELGEDPQEFRLLRQKLLESFQPSTEAARMLVEYLTSLRWQRRRLERAQAALIARRVQKLEIKRQRHSLQVSQETTEPIPLAQLDIGLIHDADSPTKFQKLLEWLEALKSMAEDGRFADWEILLKCVYGPTPTLRGGIVRGLFKTLMSTSEGAEPDRASLTALRRELEAEIANVTQQYHLYIRKHVELTPVMRDECLAPTEAQRWLMREMNLIDRQIAQKTRLLLEMERAHREAEKELAAAENAGVRSHKEHNRFSSEPQERSQVWPTGVRGKRECLDVTGPK